MSKTGGGGGDEEDEDECFYESLDRLVTSSNSCSTSSSSSSDSEPDNLNINPESPVYDFCVPKFPMGVSNKYDVWISEPVSVSERRTRLLREMGLSHDPALSRAKSGPERQTGRGDFESSASSGGLTQQDQGSSVSGVGSVGIVRSKSDGSRNSKGSDDDHRHQLSNFSPSILSIHSSSVDSPPVNNNLNSTDNDDGNVIQSVVVSKSLSVKSNNEVVASATLSNKPPTGKNCKRVEENRLDSLRLLHGYGNGNYSSNSLPLNANGGEVVEHLDSNGIVAADKQVCLIRNLDNGKEFVVNEIREDGMWNKVKEVGTGRQLTMEEFEMSVGHSPLVQELMRRQNVEEGNKDNFDLAMSGNCAGGGKLKKKGSWLKSIRTVASTVTGHKEKRSSDERDRDTSSEKGGRRSSSATDDSQDVSFHGPERVRVRQYGKSCKELTALYKSQEIQAHNGSIWSIKFSLDGRYLASAGEDCVIHVWQVVESERKGELLEKPEEGNLNLLLLANGSPDPNSLSPKHVDDLLEKKRRGRPMSRKSLSMDHIVVPETVFGLSEKPICSFQGHLDDVLDLSWSKSQHLLSSSMDKTVRLWHLLSKTCLRIFSHSDYDNKLQEKSPINLQSKKKSQQKKVTGFQFAPGSSSEVLITSADSRVRVVDGVDLVHKFKGFRNTNSQICASFTANGRYVVSASEDSYVYVWKHEAESRFSRKKGVTVTHSYEHFHCQDVSVAVPWPGMGDLCGLQDTYSGDQSGVDNNFDEFSMANHPPTPVEEINSIEGSQSASGCTNSPLNGTISSATDSYFFDRISATWPEERLYLAARNRSPRASVDFANGLSSNMSAWGMVVVTATLRGEIRTFQNFGLPVRL
ncbi:uncharacterized protein LOC123202049 isoform X2 [Mangifera indica]|uniref:uncharacterized protein LOC123202049 isoform X2 n=1 Tax=Mangifera indica TaxID=29780 RepID=UPI001CF9720F|nr:uncharacterized protein LOC123202049 isoform X2 [Mangifera indica]